MATIQDINAGSQYVGNAAIGGGFNPSVEIDTRPLQQLAQYTFFYNRDKWQQNQKDLEDAANQLAELTTYDLTNAIPKFSKELREEYNSLYDWVQKNPTVLDYKNNEKGYLEFQKRKNDILNNIGDAKSQELLYKAGKAAIEKETRIDVKAAMKDELDNEVSTKDKRTPISLQQYDADPLVVRDVPIKTFDIIKRDVKGDIIVDRKVGIADQKFINETASAMALGFLKEQVDVNSEEFKKLSPNAQKLKLEELKRRKATGRQAIVDQAEVATMALKEFTDPTTRKIDVDKVKAKNPIMSGVIEAIDAYNKDMVETIAQIDAGAFQDELGTVKFGMNGVKKSDYAIIDYSDGEITPTDLAKLQLKAKAPTTSYTTEVKELNNAFQERQLAETIRNNKADQYLRGKELKLHEDKWKATQIGGTTQVNGAMERAKRIYRDMLKLADKNGIISPNNIRKLNVEQLKYLGIEAPQERDAEGNIISSGGFKPLDLSKEDYGIQLLNGNINVFGAKKSNDGTVIEPLKTLPDGRLVGHIDNTKSTNLPNIATNILNEELVKAGSKELNSYMGIDVLGGITSTTDGGSTTVSGSTQSKTTDINSLDPNGFKKEGKNYRYKDGTLYDAKGNIVK